MTGDAPQPGETAVESDHGTTAGDSRRPEPVTELAEPPAHADLSAGRPGDHAELPPGPPDEPAEPPADRPGERPDVDGEAEAGLDTGGWAADVPEIMVLPEPHPDRDRASVPLNRVPVPVPGQAGQHRSPAADLDVKRSRMENSPFWLTDEARAAADSTWAAGTPDRPGARPARESRPRTPHRTGRSLLGLIVLALVTAFFSWVSAEPFWLAVGHGTPGVATVARCTGSGVTQRCAGSFTASGGGFAKRVTLLGVSAAGREPGTVAPARMVSSRSRQAYVGTAGTLLHLRWVLGFALVLLCGLGIAGLTGTRQLETARARRGALLMSLAGPVVLLAGFLLAAY